MSAKFLKVGLHAEYEEALGFETSEFINASAGAADAGKPVVLDANGEIDPSMISFGSIDHGSLAGLGDDDHTIYSLADGSRDFSNIVAYASHPTFTSDSQLVDKKYVDDIQLVSEWFYKSALNYVVDNTLAPATEVLGDVYLLSHDGGVPHADFDGAAAGDIVEFNGTVWVATTPTTGTKVSVDDEPNTAYYLFGGSAWAPKLLESSTAGNGLQLSGNEFSVDPTLAGNGLGYSAGVMDVNVDDASIEIVADTLNVKALGITDAMLAGNISDAKLAQDYIQTSEVDGTTIEFAGGSLNIVTDGVDSTLIDFGLGANQVSASDLPIADGGNYTDELYVEGALQELYGLASERGVELVAGTGGVSKGDLLFVSGDNTVNTYSGITTFHKAVGLASKTSGVGASVKSLSNDTLLPGAISGATAGDVFYWDGSSHVNTIPNGSGAYVIQTGVAVNATDLYVEVRPVKKNI